MSAGHDDTQTRLARRRALLAFSARRQHAGSGSDLRGLLRRKRMTMPWRRDADSALAGVPHAVVGAVAAAAYMPERATADIDFAVVITAAPRVEAHLRSIGWQERGKLALTGLDGTSWQTAAGDPVDVLYLPDTWGQSAIAAAQANVIDGLPILPLPYLTLMKLLASRFVDTADLTRMLGHQDDATLVDVRAVIAAHGRPEDVADLEQIIALGRLEYGGAGSANGAS
jgi:hypothetical protein